MILLCFILEGRPVGSKQMHLISPWDGLTNDKYMWAGKETGHRHGLCGRQWSGENKDTKYTRAAAQSMVYDPFARCETCATSLLR